MENYSLKLIAFMLILSVGFLSCEKEGEEPQTLDCDCAEELFYYYSGEKLFIDTLLINDWLLVGFESQVQDVEIVNFINQTGLFKSVDESNIVLYAQSEDNYNMIFVNTKTSKTCSQLREVIKTLEKSSLIAFANLTFETTAWFGGVYMDIMAYTNEITVHLKNLDDLPDLQNITLETNIRIKKQNEFVPEQYIVIADKNSKGDALQMANYFTETGKFEWASPDFLYAKIDR
jgi:hypothetical protein